MEFCQWHLGLIWPSLKTSALLPASGVPESLLHGSNLDRAGIGIADCGVHIRMTVLGLLHRTTAEQHERPVWAGVTTDPAGVPCADA